MTTVARATVGAAHESPRKPGGASAWSVETRSDDGCLASLGSEWDDLVQRCPAATPFQSPGWLGSWWRAYGVPGRLRVMLVRRDGRLVAAAAMMAVWRGPATVLVPLGGPLSDFTDVLVDPDDGGTEALRLLAGALRGRRGWQAVDFPETRPGAVAAAGLPTVWRGRHCDLPASVCLELPVTPVEHLVRELPRHARKTVRRRLNQIERLGMLARPVPPPEAERAVAQLLRLHERQWQGRGGNPAHRTGAFAAHLGPAARMMIEQGQAELLEYVLEDRVVASSLVITGTDLAGGYLYGADPGLRERVDVLTLLVTSTMALAHRRGCSTMSMLRGDEAYKLRWRPREAVNRRVVLVAPGSVRGTAYAMAVRLRSAARRTARARAPWLRSIRDTAHRAAERLRRGHG